MLPSNETSIVNYSEKNHRNRALIQRILKSNKSTHCFVNLSFLGYFSESGDDAFKFLNSSGVWKRKSKMNKEGICTSTFVFLELGLKALWLAEISTVLGRSNRICSVLWTVISHWWLAYMISILEVNTIKGFPLNFLKHCAILFILWVSKLFWIVKNDGVSLHTLLWQRLTRNNVQRDISSGLWGGCSPLWWEGKNVQ